MVWLHQFLFDEEDYEVSPSVQEISNRIVERSGVTRENGGNY